MTASTAAGIVLLDGGLAPDPPWSRFLQLLEAGGDLAGRTVHRFRSVSPLTTPPGPGVVPDFDRPARKLDAFLATAGDGELVLVAHSDAGLVVLWWLARMVGGGRAAELARIRRIVLFACPSTATELVAVAGGWGAAWRSPAPPELRRMRLALDRVHGTVRERVVEAGEVTPDACPVDIVGYVGDRDRVVTAEPARRVLPRVGMLPGDHFSIIQPDSLRHPAYLALTWQLRGEGGGGAGPAPRQAARVPHAGVAGPEHRARIVELLLAVPGITVPAFRQQLYDLLPPELVGQLRRDAAARLELVDLVRTCARYQHLDSWDRLVGGLVVLVPDHPAVTELASFLAEADLVRRR